MRTTITDEFQAGAWMSTVAALLPVPYKEAPAFTLGEAVHELGLWAATARDESWDRARRSLLADVEHCAHLIGPRVRASVSSALRDIRRRGVTRTDIIAAAAAFARDWEGNESVIAGFRDLCEEAISSTRPARDLRSLAAVLASQLGEVASSPWGPLRGAAAALTGEEIDGDPSLQNEEIPGVLLASRLQAAEECLVSELPIGDVVVWLLYRRAIISMRMDAGPVTFLRADWFLPNALRDDGQYFPEREELRGLLDEVRWLRELEETIRKPEERHVLVRVALGARSVVGARAVAKRQVEAILSIGAMAGGVSWQEVGSSAVVMNGQVFQMSRGSNGDRRHWGDDTYGMGATSEILGEAVTNLGSALKRRAMPDYLVDALEAMREASLTNHRDVSFYGERAVTPRVATALEDHVFELVASLGALPIETLAQSFRDHEVEWQFEQRLLMGLMAPFDDSEARIANSVALEQLERVLSTYRGAVRVVAVEAVVVRADEIRRLVMSELARSDFDEAVKVATNVRREQALRRSIEADVAVVADRLRRVRNSVTHGNPMTASALRSIRGLSERTARDAVELGLQSFARDERIADLLAEGSHARAADRHAREAGENYVARHPANTKPGQT